MRYLAVDIGGTYTKYAVLDQNCIFNKKGRVLTAQDSTEHFLAMLSEIYDENREGVEGIAISSAGVINSECGVMHTGGSILCVSELHIADILEKRCHVPVTVENDAKCAALAEVWKGALQHCRDAVVLLCGTAIGGALICDRKLVRGSHRLAGEFSYIITNGAEPFDVNNSFAMQCGIGTLFREIADERGISSDGLTGEEIFSDANRGDEQALKCLRAFSQRLAVQIMNLQFIFDPELFAIGGGISEQPLFIQLLREELTKLQPVFEKHFPGIPLPEITACKFFNDSNLVGALYVHLQNRR